MDSGKPRVLIVDDNQRSADVLERALRRHGYADVRRAQDVGPALALVEEFAPEVLLLNLSTSLRDGHELLRRLRGDEPRPAVPVLMLTGAHAAPAIQAAVQEGAVGFIPVPFNGLEVLYKIEQAARGRGTRIAELADLLEPDVPPHVGPAAPA